MSLGCPSKGYRTVLTRSFFDGTELREAAWDMRARRCLSLLPMCFPTRFSGKQIRLKSLISLVHPDTRPHNPKSDIGRACRYVRFTPQRRCVAAQKSGLLDHF